MSVVKSIASLILFYFGAPFKMKMPLWDDIYILNDTYSFGAKAQQWRAMKTRRDQNPRSKMWSKSSLGFRGRIINRPNKDCVKDASGPKPIYAVSYM